jgi:DNA-binding NtrC family response regulator
MERSPFDQARPRWGRRNFRYCDKMKVVEPGGVMSAKVLIVDDDEATRLGLKQILKNGGFDAITAGTFHEGVHALRTEDPDLLIVDVRLGEYNGLQLIITTEKKIPAIVLTGYADRVVEDEAHHEGAEYLLKPIEPASLVLLIRRMLSAATAEPAGS